MTALYRSFPKGLSLKVNNLNFLLCWKGFQCIKTNSKFIFLATRMKNSNSAMIYLYLLTKIPGSYADKGVCTGLCSVLP